MEIKKIVLDTNKSLRAKSLSCKEPITKQDKDLAMYLHDYLVFADNEENAEKYNLRPGVGLASPQIGINKRIVAVYIAYKDEEGKIEKITEYALINPRIISHSERVAYLLGGEGCLSVENPHEGFVPRYAIVTVKGFNVLTNQEEIIKLRGYEAIVIQHELDHLDGILFYDHINKRDPFKHIDGALEI